MHAIETIKHYLGWCPNSPLLKGHIPLDERVSRAPETSVPDGPRPDSALGPKTGSPDWFTAVASIILFATCFFGGLVWWPFFVLAVLVVGFAVSRGSRRTTGRA